MTDDREGDLEIDEVIEEQQMDQEIDKTVKE